MDMKTDPPTTPPAVDFGKLDFTVWTPEKLIKRWRELDEQKEKLKALHAAEMKPIDDAMELMIKCLSVFMAQTGQKNVPTEYGTAYKSPWFSAKVSDPTAWWNWVFSLSREHAINFLTLNVSKDSIKKYLDHNSNPPPGITTDKGSNTTVRRK